MILERGQDDRPLVDEREAGGPDPPDDLAELRAVLLNEQQWRQREGLDSPLPAA